MMKTASSAQIRRSVDPAHRRKPLRVQISRRRKPVSSGPDRFVTQVRFGGAEAVVVPWDRYPRLASGRVAAAAAAASPPRSGRLGRGLALRDRALGLLGSDDRDRQTELLHPTGKISPQPL
jgi:hypothetical protein